MLKSIGKVIVTIVDGVAKCCAALLLTLGLWVPALFSILFLMCRTALGAPFNGIVQVVYFMGLGVSIMAGISFALYRRKQAKNKSKGVESVKEQKKRGDDFETTVRSGAVKNLKKEKQAKIKQAETKCHPAFNGEYVIPDGYDAERDNEFNAPKQQNNNQYSVSQQNASPQQYSYNGQNRQQFIEPQQQYVTDGRTTGKNDEIIVSCPSRELKQEIKNATTREYDYKVKGLGADTLWERLSGASHPNEQPMVFATRSDPNVFVYEYSDRLQYWRRTNKGMTLLGTEFKNNDNVKKQR